MAVDLKDMVSAANGLLRPETFDDYCPNGLQVEGKSRVEKLVTGVTASQALIDQAVEQGVDAILVHHGYFWKGEDPCVVGVKRQRLASLLANGVSLLAYHLPLDAHPELGNNAQLALRFGLEITGGLKPAGADSIGNIGVLPSPINVEEFVDRVGSSLEREPLLIEGGPATIQTVAWCSGAAQGYIDQAAILGADLYLSGEISEPTVHMARELGIHYLAAGHHATERYGVEALGDWLADRFDLDHQFIDVNNPV